MALPVTGIVVERGVLQTLLNMKKVLIPVLLASLMLVGCTQTQLMMYEKQIRAAEAQAGIITEPMVLEVDYVTPQLISDSTVFNITRYSDDRELRTDLPAFKQEALERFCFKSQFDMIVNTTFLTYTRNEGKELVVVIKGYGVRYKKLRKATQEDIWMSNFKSR